MKLHKTKRNYLSVESANSGRCSRRLKSAARCVVGVIKLQKVFLRFSRHDKVSFWFMVSRDAKILSLSDYSTSHYMLDINIASQTTFLFQAIFFSLQTFVQSIWKLKHNLEKLFSSYGLTKGNKCSLHGVRIRNV